MRLSEGEEHEDALGLAMIDVTDAGERVVGEVERISMDEGILRALNHRS